MSEQKLKNEVSYKFLLTSNGIQKHEIFEVGYFSALPLLRHIRASH